MMAADGESSRTLPGLFTDGDPIFAEPWQADACAMTHALIDVGVFSRAEWTSALAAAITKAQLTGDPDLGDTYYQHWLAALEGLCLAKLALTATEVDTREQAWRAAYRRTPHGTPVDLHPTA